MKHLLLGVLLGVCLSAASVAGFSLTVLRDQDGWEIITAQEMENVNENIGRLFAELMRLRMIVAKGGCS